MSSSVNFQSLAKTGASRNNEDDNSHLETYGMKETVMSNSLDQQGIRRSMARSEHSMTFKKGSAK